jgi:hypothetical protein
VFTENLRQPLITVRGFIHAGAAQLDSLRTHSCIISGVTFGARLTSPVLRSIFPLASILPITRPAPWIVE